LCACLMYWCYQLLRLYSIGYTFQFTRREG
jgi:hypothetical protein